MPAFAPVDNLFDGGGFVVWMAGEGELVEVALELGEGACGVEPVLLLDLLELLGLEFVLGELIKDVETTLLDPLVRCAGGGVCCPLSLCVPITTNADVKLTLPPVPAPAAEVVSITLTHQYPIPAQQFAPYTKPVLLPGTTMLVQEALVVRYLLQLSASTQGF
jgi:hypothetical protein